MPTSTRELLFSVVGLDVDDSMESYELVAERVFRWEVDLGSDALSEERGNVSSPDDIVRLLELVHRGDILSPSSQEEGVLDILKRQQATTIIPHDLPTGTVVAHKTGGFYSVRGDAGIVYVPTGPYAVALMAKRVTDMGAIDAALAAVSRAIYDEMGV